MFFQLSFNKTLLKRRFSNDLGGAETTHQHSVFAILNGLRTSRLPPVPSQPAVHLLPGNKPATAATNELAVDDLPVPMVPVPNRTTGPLHGHIRLDLPLVVLHDHIHALAHHVLLDIESQDQLLHNESGGVQRARGDLRKVLQLRLLVHLHFRLL